MALDVVVQGLLRVELFAGLRPLQITELARRAYRIVYKPGDVIIADGAIGDAAILIIKGEVARIAGPHGDVEERVPEGALLGEMAMLIETMHTSTVVARTMTRAVRITRDQLHEIIAGDTGFADHLSAKLSRRLTATAQTLKAIDITFSRFDPIVMPSPYIPQLNVLAH